MVSKYLYSFSSLLVLTALGNGTVASRLNLRDVICSFPVVASNGETCSSVAAAWGIDVADLEALNPGVSCPTLVVGQQYCVFGTVTTPTPSSSAPAVSATEVPGVSTTDVPGVSTTDAPSTTLKTVTTSTSTTSASPYQPTQDGLAANCNKFYFVEAGDSCDTITAKFGISFTDFYAWNPAVGPQCTTMWASTYACVSVVGSTPRPSTTLPANGVATPSPTHPGMMVTNCNKFTKVNRGDSCDSIAFFNGPIATEDFVLWNSGVGGRQCRTLQPDTYVCIGLIKATPTQPGNTVATPMPTHPGMVTNCNKFFKVNQGDSCDAIAFFNGPIATEDFVLWNRGVGGRECRTLQANTYACIGLVKGTPTQPGNGIATPAPSHPGMVSNCKKFVYVNPGDTCNNIAFFNGPISTENFIKWNTGVGGMECRGLQANTYACIGV